MDEAVKPSTTPLRTRLCAVLALLCASAGTAAQSLQDPTRPPAGAAAFPAAPSAAVSGPQLQTILVAQGAGGRRMAVIDGETVRPGERFQGARVERIGEDEVVLVRGRERKVLRLYAPDATQAGITPAARTTAQR